MTIKTIAAIVLIAVSVVVLAYHGITHTTSVKVVAPSPLQVTAEKTKSIPLPPIIAAVVHMGGIVLLSVGNKKT